MRGPRRMLECGWLSFKVSGKPGYILAEKLKLLKAKLKEWSKTNRGNWKQHKEISSTKLQIWRVSRSKKILRMTKCYKKPTWL